MLGILDSGRGGENTATEILRLDPSAKILLLLDRENAPYGERTEAELIPIVEHGITRLCEMGAEKILLACCTASSVYDKLSPEARDIAIPIIDPVARRAAEMANGGKIALIATNRTVASGEFDRYLGDSLALSIPASDLVCLIEGGASDENLTEEAAKYLDGLLRPLAGADIRVLILGCTHFESLGESIKEALAKITTNKIMIADSARIAALTVIGH